MTERGGPRFVSVFHTAVLAAAAAAAALLRLQEEPPRGRKGTPAFSGEPRVGDLNDI